MRCYFYRGGHITAVVELNKADGDDGCIRCAQNLFEAHADGLPPEGFEVWDEARLVFQFPLEAQAAQ